MGTLNHPKSSSWALLFVSCLRRHCAQPKQFMPVFFFLRIYAVEIYGWIFLFLTLKFLLFRALEKIAPSLKNGYFVYIYQILLTVSAKSANYEIHVSICQPTIKYIWSKLHETIGIYIIEKQKNMTHRYLYRHWGRSKNAHAKINKKNWYENL